MLQLCCTQNALKQFGLSKANLCDNVVGDGALGNWYVNVLTISRRKCVLFMSERTLLSFLLFGVRKDNSKDIAEVFVRGVAQLLEKEEFTADEIGACFGENAIITLAKTSSRQVLGAMNDLMRIYDHMIWYQGGWESCDLWGIMTKLNRMPQRLIGWRYSIDLSRELVRERMGAA